MPSLFSLAKNATMRYSRSRKLNHFYALCNTSSSVLDVGVSRRVQDDSINLFLKTFRLPSSQYTGLGVESMDKIQAKHPDKKFVEYPGGIFPFAENEFDWVFSNAVIEHVGNRQDQLIFINEMLRVGKQVFFTTPNKGFPIESHTDVLFRHWFDNSFYEWCRVNESSWGAHNLLLLTRRKLKKLLEESNAQNYKIHNNKLLGWPMTFTVVCSSGRSQPLEDKKRIEVVAM